MALNPDEARAVIGDMWALHMSERYRFERVARYLDGSAGLPSIPRSASEDVRDIQRISGKNVIGVVIDSFAQNLNVSGFRNARSEVNATAWTRWKRERLATRQDEVHRSALTFGTGYAVVLPDDAEGSARARVRYRSPRRLLAVYRDPAVDVFPEYALETWVANEGGRRVLRGLLLDSENGYPLSLGGVPLSLGTLNIERVLTGRASLGEPIPHGAGVTPVVKFTDYCDDGRVSGEVEPLMVLQRAINSVNFDRLTVSRFGAFPQKVISGWSGSREEQLAASAKDLWTFEDPDVRAQVLMGSDGKGYNDLITEMMEHVAMVAQLSPAQITGKMVNLSAEALAAGEKSQQRKLSRMRTSFGESHADVIRLMARIEGDIEGAEDFESEVIWQDTEARAFAAVVDGVVKMANVGVPIEELLDLIPGITPSQRESIRRKMRVGGDFNSLMNSILNEAEVQVPASPEPAEPTSSPGGN